MATMMLAMMRGAMRPGACASAAALLRGTCSCMGRRGFSCQGPVQEEKRAQSQNSATRLSDFVVSNKSTLQYEQGQTVKGRREYFYFIDHNGFLFLDDAMMKNFTSCLKGETKATTAAATTTARESLRRAGFLEVI